MILQLQCKNLIYLYRKQTAVKNVEFASSVSCINCDFLKENYMLNSEKKQDICISALALF